MRYYPSSLLESASWYSFNDSYIGRSKWFLPRQSDPSILLPSESPDGRWHLFCHTWLGIHHLVSDSGLKWKKEDALVFFRGHSPFIYREGKTYYMVFERHDFKSNDKDVTKRIQRAGEILGIRILDHLIISTDAYYSFLEHGLM